MRKHLRMTLALGALLGGSPHHGMPHRGVVHSGSPPRTLMIRVSQESSPGAGDFDAHILGFLQALQSTGTASDFYEYARNAANYGNSAPVLTANTSHLFFVNAADGLSLFIVHNNSNHPENGIGGAASARFVLSGGTADVLLSDDDGEGYMSDGGTLFVGDWAWSQNNTDGMVIGALPVSFTIVGGFIERPAEVSTWGQLKAWKAISADGSSIPLSLVIGQRVRLDVPLRVRVRQDR